MVNLKQYKFHDYLQDHYHLLHWERLHYHHHSVLNLVSLFFFYFQVFYLLTMLIRSCYSVLFVINITFILHLFGLYTLLIDSLLFCCCLYCLLCLILGIFARLKGHSISSSLKYYSYWRSNQTLATWFLNYFRTSNFLIKVKSYQIWAT